ncbi:MAG: NAD(P)-dependent oxidoreductase [Azospirillum brasilense]|nr:MAG: NAD(P)-dependent oxidoreductase [Azospirillum brasilense]
MSTPVVGFVGFGEAARCFAGHLAGQGVRVHAFCEGATNRPPYPPGFRAQAEALGATLHDTLGELLDVASVVFSAVVVASALNVGQAIADSLRPGTLVVDINAATPRVKQDIAAAITVRGGSYVDANLMGAAGLYGPTVPLYCSGDGAARFAELFAPLGLTVEVAGETPGSAAAVKMLRSVVTKGIEALVVEAMTAAALAGVRREALAGICGPMDATRFSDFLDMCLRTDVLHAGRRAVEMDGAADCLRELGLVPVMTEATAARLRASATMDLRREFLARPGYDADTVLDAYVARVKASQP